MRISRNIIGDDRKKVKGKTKYQTHKSKDKHNREKQSCRERKAKAKNHIEQM